MRYVVVGFVAAVAATVLAAPAGATLKLETAVGRAQTIGNGASAAAAISSDGRYIAFVSDANNFGPTDTNGAPDVYRLDRQTGTFQLVDVGPDSQQADAGAATCGGCVALSNDGRYVAFISQATNLTGLPTNQTYQVYVRDMTQGITTMVSQAAGGGGGDNSSGVVGQAQGFPISMSSDGRYVAFSSQASDLVVGAGGNLRILAYARDVVSGKTAVISTSTTGAVADGDSYVG